MFNVAHVLSPAMLDALTENFQNLNPKPLTKACSRGAHCGRQENLRRGNSELRRSAVRRMSWARGQGRGSVSASSGQLSDYVADKLTNWANERGQNPANPDTSAIMAPIAHSLNQQQIKAVAAYLNHLE